MENKDIKETLEKIVISIEKNTIELNKANKLKELDFLMKTELNPNNSEVRRKLNEIMKPK